MSSRHELGSGTRQTASDFGKDHIKTSNKQTPSSGDLSSFALLEANLKSDPIEFFTAASRETLQALMLSRMNAAANIKRDISILIYEMAEQLAEARVAEILMKRKKTRKEKAASQ